MSRRKRKNVLSVLGTSQSRLAHLSPVERVFALEEKIRRLPQVKFPLRHFFVGDVYVGEMFIPSGHVLTGHIHLYEHHAICSAGRLSIYDETGVHEVRAGDIFISKPGIKRAGYAHEDSRFINVIRMHEPWPKMDDYAPMFTVETLEEYQEFLKKGRS